MLPLEIGLEDPNCKTRALEDPSRTKMTKAAHERSKCLWIFASNADDQERRINWDLLCCRNNDLMPGLSGSQASFPLGCKVVIPLLMPSTRKGAPQLVWTQQTSADVASVTYGSLEFSCDGSAENHLCRPELPC